MLRLIADTHAVIWYLFGDQRLSGRARSAIDEAATAGDEVGVSTISLAEIVYLEDKGRLPEGTFEELAGSLEDPRTVLVAVPFDLRVARAMKEVSRAEVPDLPDRIIAATAVSRGATLLSRDGAIRVSQVPTLW